MGCPFTSEFFPPLSLFLHQKCIMKITNVPMPNLLQNSSTSPDFHLIQRLQTGESGVFDRLYYRHHDRIHDVIHATISNPEDAGDLTQEAFFKAYQGLEHFKNESEFYTWLYRIAVNHCIEHMRW